MPEDRLLTVPEVAERLRVNPESVRRWIRQRKIRGVRLGGPRTGWRVLESEVEAFIRRASEPPAKETDSRRPARSGATRARAAHSKRVQEAGMAILVGSGGE